MVPTEDNKNTDISTKDETNSNETKEKLRNLIAYWILGLCNNYGYVVMLSAANDILHEQEGDSDADTKLVKMYDFRNSSKIDNARDCNYISTGAILLADILPALLVKFVAPFLPFFVNIRVGICVLLSTSGFLLVAFSTAQWMSLLGVIVTSFSSGLGEVTYLQYSSFYDKNVVSTWSSGTGGAGVFGALSYATLSKLGLQNALLIMLIVPAAMAVSFWGILLKPVIKATTAAQQMINDEELKNPKDALVKKVKRIPGLMKYMIPLGLVYLNILLTKFELIQFDGIFIGADEQYRWLQVDYQIGVFISRSSVNLLHIKRIWLMAVFQLINVFIFTSEAIFYFIPSFYVVLAVTLWEGLLGGAAYVNTFYKISADVPEEEKQFSMAVTSFADTIGITFAGIFAIFAHNAICDMPKPGS